MLTMLVVLAVSMPMFLIGWYITDRYAAGKPDSILAAFGSIMAIIGGSASFMTLAALLVMAVQRVLG